MSTPNDVLLEAIDVHRNFGDFAAVRGMNMTIRRSEMVGLVGESGSGKTTFGQTILRMQEPSAGRVLFEGRDLAQIPKKELRALRPQLQYIFQDPYGSLNPRLSVEQAIGEPLLVHGLSTTDSVRADVEAALEMCGMPADAADRYPHEFSGGQRQRIVIARAMALGPKFVVADEPVSALDVSIQAQIINLFADLREQEETSFLFISHDLSVVEHLCDRILIMYRGVVVEEGTKDHIFTDPRHPYTQTLLDAVPIPDPRRRTRHTAQPFAEYSTSPVMHDVGGGHLVAEV